MIFGVGELHRVETQVVCVVEGADDAAFLEAIRALAGIPEIGFTVAGSIDAISPLLKALRAQGRITRPGTSVGVLIDADDDPETAMRRLEGWRRDHATAGVHWAVALLPGDGPGELESLVTRVLDPDLAVCIDAFVACVDPSVRAR